MPIYKGNKNITKVYQGENEIDKVYRGTSKVFGVDKGTQITVSGNPLILTNVASAGRLDTLEINGRTEQNGVPTPDNPIEIVNINSLEVVNSGKNLLVNGDDLLRAKNWVKKEDGSYQGMTNNAYVISVINANPFFQIGYKPKTPYTLSCKVKSLETPKSVYVGWVYTDDTREQSVNFTALEYDVKITSNPAKDVKGMFISYGTSSMINISNIQIEQGTEATPYEPYKPIHIATIDNIELTKWDKIVKRNGVWGVSKWSYKIDNWTPYLVQNWARDYGFVVTVNKPMPKQANASGNKNGDIALPTHFVAGSSSWSTRLKDELITNYTSFVITVERVLSATQFKQWLIDNNVVVWYQTETEYNFVPLSQTIQDQLNALQIYKSTTIVSNNAECEMSAKYFCYLDSTEAMLTSLYNNDLSEVLK